MKNKKEKKENKLPSLGAFVEQVAKMIRTETKSTLKEKKTRIIKPGETSLSNKVEQVAQLLRKAVRSSKRK